jgi:hypothetical protein
MTEEIHPPGTTLELVVGGVQLESAPLPEECWIGRVDRTKELYRAEDRVVEAIKAAAVEQARLHGWVTTKGRDFYRRAVPAALMHALDSFDPSTSVAAAVAYLQTKGITVNATVIPQRESDGDREPD